MAFNLDFPPICEDAILAKKTKEVDAHEYCSVEKAIIRRGGPVQ